MLAARHHASHVATMAGLARVTRGGDVLALPGGVVACVVPERPGRSLFNCVAYEEGDALLAALDAIEAAYADARVHAWTVWVHPGDTHVDAALEAAGHALDGAPQLMAAPLDEVDLAAADPVGVRIGPADARSGGEVNDVAWEQAPGDFAGLLDRDGSPLRWWGAWDGERLLSCAATVEHDGDAYVTFVATRPEARRRGLAAAALRHGLRDAAARGCTTTSLEASTMGRSVYGAMGYRELGALRMRERRTAPGQAVQQDPAQG